MKMNKFNVISMLMVLALFFAAGNVQAQKKYVNKALSWAQKGEDLDTALVLLNKALEDEKTKDWAKTYYARGILFKAISTTQNESFKKLSEYPLVEAGDNFEKAYSSDGAGGIKSLLDYETFALPNDINNAAMNCNKEGNYEGAYLHFEKTFELKKLDLFGNEIDTIIVFNTALMALRAENYDAAIKYFSLAIEHNYGEGDTYSNLADTYKAKGDTENYLNTLKTGFKKYPDHQTLFGNLINYFLTESKNPQEAIEYLDYAIEAHPNNAALYTGKGIFYSQIDDKEKAVASYKKAIEVDNNSLEAYYNLGVLYFNEGVGLYDKSNEITDNTKYAAAKEKADNKFKEALQYIEKAYEIDNTDPELKKILKQLYYRLQMQEEYDSLN